MYLSRPLVPCRTLIRLSRIITHQLNIFIYTLLNRLSAAEIAKTQPCDDAMIVDEPVKPVAGSSKHPDDMDIIDGELIY